MKQNIQHFAIGDCNEFKLKMLDWVSRFSIFCFLDNGNYNSDSFEALLAAGSKRSVTLERGNAFESLKKFYDMAPGWLFGHLGYNASDQLNRFISKGFPDGFFFTPEFVLRLTKKELIVESYISDPAALFKAINEQKPIHLISSGSVRVQHRITQKEYIKIIKAIRDHIQRGDCYELNYCQEFFAENAVIDPLSVFKKLQRVSSNPFSAFYKVKDNYCMCASPERFLKKSGQQLISQPIKGTSRRDKDPATDEKNKAYLKNSQKEKSENVMVVDLVRNDLSKICIEGSVQVKELFGIYSFPQVHQMISTITGIMPEEMHWTNALVATFPMGSMTGAPKKRVMELIAQYEKAERGLFSGSIGYVTPDADFDFNVVIRSIFYNDISRYLSFWAGGGITFYSDPLLEYDECLLKAEAIRQVLNN